MSGVHPLPSLHDLDLPPQRKNEMIFVAEQAQFQKIHTFANTGAAPFRVLRNSLSAKKRSNVTWALNATVRFDSIRSEVAVFGSAESKEEILSSIKVCALATRECLC